MNHARVRVHQVVLPVISCLVTFAAPLWAQSDGAVQFKAKCVACHGTDGSGNTAVGKSMKLRDLGSPDVQKETDEELTAIIASGKGAMPSYKDKLTADQIKQIVGFIRQLGKQT